MAREDEFAGLDEPGQTGGRASETVRPFAPEQMVACEECLRANPPTRMACLYCGRKLPQTPQGTALQRPALKKLEEWEHGFNVVTLAPAAR